MPSPENAPKIRVLNLYAGIGGNRKLWDNVEVTAVEIDPQIAAEYKKNFPQDTVVIGDAHEYLIKNFKYFDFIWSSPPCPSHSRTNAFLRAKNIVRYPDMTLYQEIIFLKHNFFGKWVVENVIPYYKPLVEPTCVRDRHYLWSNFYIPSKGCVNASELTLKDTKATSERHGFTVKAKSAKRGVMLRNLVDPKVGQIVFSAAFKQKQEVLLI